MTIKLHNGCTTTHDGIVVDYTEVMEDSPNRQYQIEVQGPVFNGHPNLVVGHYVYNEGKKICVMYDREWRAKNAEIVTVEHYRKMEDQNASHKCSYNALRLPEKYNSILSLLRKAYDHIMV